jgi:hypothetical protein
MFKRLFTATVLFGMAATAPPAFAANCALRDVVVERLESQFSERLTAGGLQASRANSSLIEVWTSKDTGTFTVIVTNPQGISCVVAAGTDWFQQELVKESEGVKS